jgi:uncharacterized protein YdaU (DUF1376 family)
VAKGRNMNFYPFHIGDYAAHTRGLAPLEDLAYRRLLDEYYLREAPLQGTAEELARDIGLNDRSTDVQRVLDRYFKNGPDWWRHGRCDDEIAAYHARVKQASAAGRASAEARNAKQNNRMLQLNDCSTSVQQPVERPCNQPRTINQEPDIPIETKSLLDGEAGQKPARGRKLPADWTPTDQHRELAGSLAVDMAGELQQFIDHHRARGSTMLDWDAAFRTWLRNAAKFAGKGGRKGSASGIRWTGFDKVNYREGVNEDGTF